MSSDSAMLFQVCGDRDRLSPAVRIAVPQLALLQSSRGGAISIGVDVVPSPQICERQLVRRNTDDGSVLLGQPLDPMWEVSTPYRMQVRHSEDLPQHWSWVVGKRVKEQVVDPLRDLIRGVGQPPSAHRRQLGHTRHVSRVMYTSRCQRKWAMTAVSSHRDRGSGMWGSAALENGMYGTAYLSEGLVLASVARDGDPSLYSDDSVAASHEGVCRPLSFGVTRSALDIKPDWKPQSAPNPPTMICYSRQIGSKSRSWMLSSEYDNICSSETADGMSGSFDPSRNRDCLACFSLGERVFSLSPGPPSASV
jgi:hypothetical protein